MIAFITSRGHPVLETACIERKQNVLKASLLREISHLLGVRIPFFKLERVAGAQIGHNYNFAQFSLFSAGRTKLCQATHKITHVETLCFTMASLILHFRGLPL